MPETSAADAVALLRRWEDSGAVWRVLERRGAHVTVGLWTCTGDELVDRVQARGEELDAYLAGRTASDAPRDRHEPAGPGRTTGAPGRQPPTPPRGPGSGQEQMPHGM